MKRDPIITATINDLKEYKRAKVAIVNLREDLCAENTRMTSPRGATLSTVPTYGGGNAFGHAMDNGIVNKDKICARLYENRRFVARMERGIAQLTPEERKVVELLYIDENSPDSVAIKIHRSRRQMYRISDTALHKLSVCFYGTNMARTNLLFVIQ